MEDNRRISPRDYLELALRPVQGSGKDIAAKNEVILNMDFNWGSKKKAISILWRHDEKKVRVLMINMQILMLFE